MARPNQQLDWRDAETETPDSGVWATPQHEPFPLVHRIPPTQDDVRLLGFFAAAPVVHDTFDDLVDEQVEAIWYARRYRRAAVKILASLTLGAVVAVTALTAYDHPVARSAVTQWATLGVAR